MSYTPAQKELLFRKVIKRLQNGESLRVILSDSGTPSRTAFYAWIEKDGKMKERFVRACEIGDEVLFEETLEIAREPLIGITKEKGPKGTTIKVGDNVARSKLIIDTIDKVLARRQPRKYGNKIDITSAGEQVGAPIFQIVLDENEDV